MKSTPIIMSPIATPLREKNNIGKSNVALLPMA